MIKPRTLFHRRGDLRPVAVLISSLALLIGGTAAFSGGSEAGTSAGDDLATGGQPIHVEDPVNAVPTSPRHAIPPQAQEAAVTLVTGQQVRLTATPDGTQEVSLVSGPASRGSVVANFTWGGDHYVVPASALPHVGTILDLRLFNVSYLARAGLDDDAASSIPVRITEDGTAASALPAVRVKRTNRDVATGGIVKSEADEFGELLANASDSATGQLAGIERITLSRPKGAPELPPAPVSLGQANATTLGPRSARSTTRFRTLTIEAIDRAGDPGYAVGFVHNLDDPRLFGFFLLSASSEPKSFSVPEGDYAIEMSVLNGPADDGAAQGALVVEPEFKVKRDTTITLDARQAVPYDVSVDPAIDEPYRQDMLAVARLNEYREGIDGSAPVPVRAMRLIAEPRNNIATLFATPTERIRRGTLEFSAYTSVVDSMNTTATARYLFVHSFERRIPSSLDMVVPRSELATVHTTVHNSPSGGTSAQPSLSVYALLPSSGTLLARGLRADPGERIDYWYSNAPDRTLWQQVARTDEGVNLSGPRRTVQHGEILRDTFNKGPLVPSPSARYTRWWFDFGGREVLCTACRQDDNGVLYISTFGDSDRRHFGSSKYFSDPSRFSLDFYQDDQLALTSSSTTPGSVNPELLALPLTPDPSTYRLDWTISRDGDPAARTETSWTFRSNPADPIAELPTRGRCAPDPSRTCSFLPMLFLTYDLDLDVDSRAPADTAFEVAFTVAHQEFQEAPTGVVATVAVSYDGGVTWTEPRPAINKGEGEFAVTVEHPALDETDGFVALRVQAQDDAGNSIAQTITRAYGLTG